jgi:adenine phosphoribosyltransferase
MKEILKSSLEESPVVKMGDYNYFVHPITDGVPEISPELLREVVDEIRNHIVDDFDKIVTIEAMGLPVGAILAVELNKPLVIIRKKQYGLDGEVSVEQVTGYSKAKLFINGLKEDDKIVIVDDVISTGGTLKAVINVLMDMGIEIIDVISVIEKGEGKKFVEEETGIEIKTLIKADVVEGRVVTTEVPFV